MCTIRNSTPLHYWSIICCTRASSTGVKVTTELCSTIISTTLTYSPVAFILSVLGIYEPYYSINWLTTKWKVYIETFSPYLPILRFWHNFLRERGGEHVLYSLQKLAFHLKLLSPASHAYFENTHLNHSLIVFYRNQRSAPGLVVKVHGVRFWLNQILPSIWELFYKYAYTHTTTWQS